ncbi:hypothetical protein BMI86_10135 [Thioclava sp. DLFJ5-1]|uniref:hypothetical protein n=1 Tax=Thioclava sp. DLFJ5-1 TaxID=1915314 RepID=UPI0009989C68|nr:hypothetical protein [Thioclava sp. DLFJ5-1]OOY20856.1 hypothetical protein BMI86_10135 [Thioclava sp. DLFJ5-1]
MNEPLEISERARIKGRREAFAFLVWRFCEPLEWNVTVQDIAAALGVSAQRVAGACRARGWTSRLRVSRRTYDTPLSSPLHDFGRDALRAGAQLTQELTFDHH